MSSRDVAAPFMHHKWGCTRAATAHMQLSPQTQQLAMPLAKQDTSGACVARARHTPAFSMRMLHAFAEAQRK